MKLKDQVAIVTGGGRGIGRAIALTYAKEGANVVIVSKTESEIESVAIESSKMGVRALAIKTDVSVEDQVEAMVQKVMDEFSHIDILVNSAGFAKHAGIHEVKTDIWDLTMNVNLRGVMLCTRAVFRNMIKQKSGYIINISSGSGKQGSAKYSTYSTSKFGVIGFTQSVASDGREYGIKASVICPGPVATRMRAGNHPGEDPTKLLQAQDIADLALFLTTQPKRVYIDEVVISPFPT
jgi:3-oxoacyl-[acyl-carrier protein] reductase